MEETAMEAGSRRLRPGRFLPLALLLAVVMVLGIGLTLNPREVPSPLIGPLTPGFVERELMPMVERLRSGRSAGE